MKVSDANGHIRRRFCIRLSQLAQFAQSIRALNVSLNLAIDDRTNNLSDDKGFQVKTVIPDRQWDELDM